MTALDLDEAIDIIYSVNGNNAALPSTADDFMLRREIEGRDNARSLLRTRPLDVACLFRFFRIKSGR